jgi:hypothetical protein
MNGGETMAFEPYERDRAYSADDEPTTSGGVGGQVFLWVAWALAAAFWAAVGTTAINILQAGDNPALTLGGGEAEGGGLQWSLMTVIGVVILGAAIAFGAWRYATRDRRKDPMTERATRAEYDAIEAAGGDDDDIPDRNFAPGRREFDVRSPPPGPHSTV